MVRIAPPSHSGTFLATKTKNPMPWPGQRHPRIPFPTYVILIILVWARSWTEQLPMEVVVTIPSRWRTIWERQPFTPEVYMDAEALRAAYGEKQLMNLLSQRFVIFSLRARLT